MTMQTYSSQSEQDLDWPSHRCRWKIVSIVWKRPQRSVNVHAFKTLCSGITVSSENRITSLSTWLASLSTAAHTLRSSTQLLLYQPATSINFQSKAFSIMAPGIQKTRLATFIPWDYKAYHILIRANCDPAIHFDLLSNIFLLHEQSNLSLSKRSRKHAKTQW